MNASPPATIATAAPASNRPALPRPERDFLVDIFILFIRRTAVEVAFSMRSSYCSTRSKTLPIRYPACLSIGRILFLQRGPFMARFVALLERHSSGKQDLKSDEFHAHIIYVFLTIR